MCTTGVFINELISKTHKNAERMQKRGAERRSASLKQGDIMILVGPNLGMGQKQAELGEKKKVFNLRMPIDLSDKVEKEAKKTGQSINKVIVDILRRIFK